jgi:hypothetical protein
MNLLIPALTALLAGPAPLLAQEPTRKDLKKAESLAAQDPDFAELSADERQEVLEWIAAEIHGERRKYRKAHVVSLSGKTLDQLEKERKKRYGRYAVVDKDQTAETVPGKKAEPEREIIHNQVDTKPFGRLFPDNQWAVDENGEDAASLRARVDEIMGLVQKTGGFLISMHVASSASTLRNTGDAAKLTHLELSERRARAAAEFARAYLRSKYSVDLPESRVTLDFDGENGNGTSGPSSPYPCPKGVDKKFCPTGSCGAPTDLKPEEIAQIYDQFKFVRLSFDVGNETVVEKPGEEAPSQEITKARMVLVALDKKQRRKIRLNLHLDDWFTRSWDNFKRLFKRKHKEWECPRF